MITRFFLKDIKKLRKQKKSLSFIGSEYNVSRERIRQILGNTGFVKTTPCPLTKKEIIKLREKGATISEITKKYKITRYTINKIIGKGNRKWSGKWKRCSTCRKILLKDNFYSEKKRGYSSYCKTCSKLLHHEWIIKNREKYNAYKRRIYLENKI